MSDEPSVPTGSESLPIAIGGFDAQIKEVFDLVQSQLATVADLQLSARQKVESYAQYVQQLKQRLDAETRRLAATLVDEQVLARQAENLRQVEMQRLAALQHFLLASAVPKKPQARDLPVLVKRLQSDMATELESLRDARLRLELRRAEVINENVQKAGTQVRIVVRGAAQIRVQFNARAGHASKKD